MSRVEEIEAAIANLPPDEYRRISDWFHTRDQARWDEQMDGDDAGGKLGFLFQEAERDVRQGLASEWPQFE